ncbi:hypothetical protein B5P43_31790 [Bacillus sp. SRB_336]|nr:hypothetical protein B5P43_31790 [Bacillus sp. SRB_336]
MKRAHATVAILSRHRKPDDPQLIDAKRTLRAEKLKAHVSKLVAEWPPLTDEQIATVAHVLYSGGPAKLTEPAPEAATLSRAA